MASTLTWLDYSERDRRRALDVIDLFRETGTVDELGLASVRDSFSDLFFPGTSTIQTRACYFLLVPWTLVRLERKRIASSKAAEWARREELLLSSRLLRGGDAAGVIGAQAGMALTRPPSQAYWGGLGSWSIRTFSGHQWAYLRSLDAFHRRVSAFRRTPHDPEGRRAPPANWHLDPHIQDPPKGFPYRNVSVTLRRSDADYLRDRIQARHPKSLLAVLAGRANAADLTHDWPWELADLAEISPGLRDQLRDARLFAICMHGAALVYNLMLSELQQNERRIDTYRRELAGWADVVGGLEAEVADWRLEGVWRVVQAQGRSPGIPMQSFVQRWVDNLNRGRPEAIVREDSTARALVRDREIQLKRGRARLASARHLELWGGRSGTGRMAYRWRVTRQILRDIFDGLERSEDLAGNA